MATKLVSAEQCARCGTWRHVHTGSFQAFDGETCRGFTPQIIIHDEYTGPRWRYGLRNRQAVFGHVPGGFIIGSQKPSSYPRYRHGSVDYPFALTYAEMTQWELEPLLLFGEDDDAKYALLVALSLSLKHEQELEPLEPSRTHFSSLVESALASTDWDMLIQSLAEGLR